MNAPAMISWLNADGTIAGPPHTPVSPAETATQPQRGRTRAKRAA